MKIAYTFYDRPNYAAGPRINALRLLPEFKQRGHEVTAVIGYRNECPAQRILENEGIQVVATPWPGRIEEQVAWFYDILPKIDPDVFVPNISLAAAYAARFCREAGRPTIVGHVGNDDFNWGMAMRFGQEGDAWAASALFCRSVENAEIVRAWKPSMTRVVELPAGVPVPANPTIQPEGLRLA